MSYLFLNPDSDSDSGSSETHDCGDQAGHLRLLKVDAILGPGDLLRSCVTWMQVTTDACSHPHRGIKMPKSMQADESGNKASIGHRLISLTRRRHTIFCRARSSGQASKSS